MTHVAFSDNFRHIWKLKNMRRKKCADADTAPLNQNILPHQCATKKISHP